MRLALPLLLLAALLLPTSSADHRLCWPDTDACLSETTSSTTDCPYASEEGVTSFYADGILVWASGERYEGCGYDAHTTVVLVRAQGSEVEWYGRTSNDPSDPGQCGIIVRQDPRHGEYEPCPLGLGPPDLGWGHLLP